MEQKNYTEVLIDGTVFTLGGAEDEAYLRKVAAYLSEKVGKIRRQDGFLKQSADYQNVTVQLNLADDYFKEQERADMLAEQKAALEKEAYSLKHKLITSQMKLESVEKELAALKKELEASKRETDLTKEGAKEKKTAQAGETTEQQNK